MSVLRKTLSRGSIATIKVDRPIPSRNVLGNWFIPSHSRIKYYQKWLNPKNTASNDEIIIPVEAPIIAASVLSLNPAITGRVIIIEITAINIAIGNGGYPFSVNGMNTKNKSKTVITRARSENRPFILPMATITVKSIMARIIMLEVLS